MLKLAALPQSKFAETKDGKGAGKVSPILLRVGQRPACSFRFASSVRYVPEKSAQPTASQSQVPGSSACTTAGSIPAHKVSLIESSELQSSAD